MAHYLLACSHDSPITNADENDLDELTANAEAAAPKYAWCRHCNEWKAVREFVTSPGK